MFQHSDLYPRYNLKRIDSPDGRRYVVPSGESYESVTTALGRWDTEKDVALKNWSEKIGRDEAERITRVSGSRGTGMHDILEKYLNNDPHCERGFMPDSIEMSRRIRRFLDEYIEKVHILEAPLYSHRYRLAGTVDSVVQCNNKLTIIDYKNARRKKKKEWIETYFLQIAAYSFMFEEMYGILPSYGIILIAPEGYSSYQAFPFRPSEYRNHKFFTERLNRYE